MSNHQYPNTLAELPEFSAGSQLMAVAEMLEKVPTGRHADWQVSHPDVATTTFNLCYSTYPLSLTIQSKNDGCTITTEYVYPTSGTDTPDHRWQYEKFTVTPVEITTNIQDASADYYHGTYWPGSWTELVNADTVDEDHAAVLRGEMFKLFTLCEDTTARQRQSYFGKLITRLHL